jgi:hypothetical protein
MPSIQAVRAALPPFRNEKVIITNRQGTGDIIREILKTHSLYETDYDRIAELFDTGDILSTANGIWDFLKYNLTYNEEGGEEQSVKSPAAILHQGENIDCKHYSLFAGGVLDAIKQKYNEPWDWCYRFATDKSGSKDPTHVFVVIKDGSREIWIDPCLYSFNWHKHWNFYIDKQPMSLVRISGTTTQAQTQISVKVNSDMAWISFLTMITHDLFSLKKLLGENPGVTTTDLRNYCIENNFDYDQLTNFINS